MANLTFRDARVRVEVAQDGAIPIEGHIDFPLTSLNSAGAQPGNRSQIVLAIERPPAAQPDQDQYILYHRLPDLQALVNAGAIAVSVKIVIRLRRGSTTVTDTVFFPIRGENILHANAHPVAFGTAPFFIYVEESSNAPGATLRSLFSVDLTGGGGGNPFAICNNPTTQQERVFCAVNGKIP